MREPKDNEIAEHVNKLREIAIRYGHTQQLRTHISREVRVFITKLKDEDNGA